MHGLFGIFGVWCIKPFFYNNKYRNSDIQYCRYSKAPKTCTFFHTSDSLHCSISISNFDKFSLFHTDSICWLLSSSFSPFFCSSSSILWLFAIRVWRIKSFISLLHLILNSNFIHIRINSQTM